MARWNQLYDRLHASLSGMTGVVIPARKQDEFYVGSSGQFRAEGLATSAIPKLWRMCQTRVELKWFGDDEPKAFTSRYDSWRYIDDIPVLPTTLRVLENSGYAGTINLLNW